MTRIMPGLAMTNYAAGSLVLLGAIATLAGGCSRGNSPGSSPTTGKKVLLGTVDEHFEPEGNLEELRIINSSGNVEIVSATGSSIEVEAEVKVAESRTDEFEDGKALLFDDHISVHQEAGL